HHALVVLLPGGVPGRTSARIARELAEVSVVLVQRLFADDDVESARERGEHELRRPRLPELELDAVWIEHRDLAYRGEEWGPRHDDAFRWPHDPGERRLHVLRGEVGAVVELNAASWLRASARVWRRVTMSAPPATTPRRRRKPRRLTTPRMIGKDTTRMTCVLPFWPGLRCSRPASRGGFLGEDPESSPGAHQLG